MVEPYKPLYTVKQPIDESIKEMEAYFEQQKESGSGPPVE